MLIIGTKTLRLQVTPKSFSSDPENQSQRIYVSALASLPPIKLSSGHVWQNDSQQKTSSRSKGLNCALNVPRDANNFPSSQLRYYHLPESQASAGMDQTSQWFGATLFLGVRKGKDQKGSDSRKGTNKNENRHCSIACNGSRRFPLKNKLTSTSLLKKKYSKSVSQVAEIHCGQFGQAGAKVITYGFLGSNRHEMSKKNIGFDTS